ncbi:MAG: N-acetyltransferase [Gammaproteobacteria bacterium]|nr:N-acetyltransferase [Gammaproteobacteria bacterium]
MDPVIRHETPADRAVVEALLEDAFGGRDEVILLGRLRDAVRPAVSLVAESRGVVAGHVFFSSVAIEGADPAPPAAGLAPLAVVPPMQGRGIGAALVHAGLDACREIGWQAVFVLGDPGYYARFGFVPAAAHGLHYESEAFDAAFQMIELVPGALSGYRGLVRFHPAFDGL